MSSCFVLVLRILKNSRHLENLPLVAWSSIPLAMTLNLSDDHLLHELMYLSQQSDYVSLFTGRVLSLKLCLCFVTGH